MSRFFNFPLTTWFESDGRDPAPLKGLKRPGGSDPARPAPSGPWMLVVAMIVVVALLFTLQYASGGGSQVGYSFFRSQLESGDTGNVKSVVFIDDKIVGEWKEPPDDPDLAASDDPKKAGKKLAKKFTTYVPKEDKELIPLLQKRHVTYSSEPANWGPGANLFVTAVSTLLVVGFVWFMLRRSADPLGPGGMAGSFIRSPAKRFTPSEQHNTFDDVAGMEQAKRELQEVVEFLKNPAKFQRLGAQVPKGVLLVGPPGTGKTLLARAAAGEAGVPFFSISGSEFIQMFVGVGASRVRDMFKTAKENAPSILFIDEIDAVGRMRGAGVGGGSDEREQTLNQILSEMDGFTPTEAVIVMAATNRPDVLDSALLRPGRFDRHVTIDRPTWQGRLAILKVHTRNKPLADDVNLEQVARGMTGMTGADLRNLANEAALLATREGKNKIDRADFERAADRVLIGAKREEVLTPEEKRRTAYHESGHALCAWFTPGADPLFKLTIIPRGRSLRSE